MKKELSIYLDLIRFAAALGVFLSHLSTYPFTQDTVWWRLSCYADYCVTIFFVLSGFVIAHVTAIKERSASEYAASRISRLYSVVLIALAATFLFDLLGSHINPELYQIQKVLWKPESWIGYLSSLAFVNEFQIFGFGGIAPGTNGPFWSLSFEAAYYVAAGLLLFVDKRIALPLLLGLLFVGGITIAALLPIWAAGFYLYRYSGVIRLPKPLAATLFVGSLTLLIEAPVILPHLPSDNFGAYFPWGRKPFNRNLIADYLVTIAFCVHLIAAREFLPSMASINKRFVSVIRWLGSLTFPLYCIHYPALCFFRAVSPWKVDLYGNLAFIVISVFAVIIILSPVCDWLKNRMRPALLLSFNSSIKMAT